MPSPEEVLADQGSSSQSLKSSTASLSWSVDVFVTSIWVRLERAKWYLGTFKSCGGIPEGRFLQGQTRPRQLPSILLFENNSIAFRSVVDKHGLETKRCPECRRGYIMGDSKGHD